MANKMRYHGLSKHPLYTRFIDINRRCNNPKRGAYKSYGARGIKNLFPDFASFYEWSILNGYDERLELDRIDNDGHYEPDNCRWTSHKTNCINRSTTKLTESDVLEIRRLYKSTLKQELADRFNLDLTYLYKVAKGVYWKQVKTNE